MVSDADGRLREIRELSWATGAGAGAEVVTHTTTLAYDGAGRLSTVTDPAGNRYALTYDALDRLIRIEGDLLAQPVELYYDLLGLAGEVQGDAATHVVTDLSGAARAYTRDGEAPQFAHHDDRGLVALVSDEAGLLAAYTYGPWGELQGSALAPGAVQPPLLGERAYLLPLGGGAATPLLHHLGGGTFWPQGAPVDTAGRPRQAALRPPMPQVGDQPTPSQPAMRLGGEQVLGLRALAQVTVPQPAIPGDAGLFLP